MSEIDLLRQNLTKKWNWFFKYHGIEHKFVYGIFKHNKWLKHEQIMIQLSH